MLPKPEVPRKTVYRNPEMPVYYLQGGMRTESSPRGPKVRGKANSGRGQEMAGARKHRCGDASSEAAGGLRNVNTAGEASCGLGSLMGWEKGERRKGKEFIYWFLLGSCFSQFSLHKSKLFCAPGLCSQLCLRPSREVKPVSSGAASELGNGIVLPSATMRPMGCAFQTARE